MIEELEMEPRDDSKVLIEGEDYTVDTAYIYENDKKIRLQKLTDQGRAKLKVQHKQLFEDENLPQYMVPIDKNHKLTEGTVVKMDMLLALSIIRRKNGGYICTFTDDFSKLEKEEILASVQSIDEDGVNLIFEKWPDEYLKRDFITRQLGVRPTGGLEIIREPITVGPSAKTTLNTLQTGRPNEDLWGWARNAIARNIPKR